MASTAWKFVVFTNVFLTEKDGLFRWHTLQNVKRIWMSQKHSKHGAWVLLFCWGSSFESRQKLKKKQKGQNVTVSFSLTFHFSLDSSFHFFSLRPLSYAVFIQIIFTQSCFNLCWQYCVRVTQDKLWSCELHGNWIQVQTVRRREEDAHKSTKWDQWKCQKTQIEVPVCVQTELSKD